MNPENTWVLDYCIPASWTINLMKPEGEWDYEVRINSPEWADLQEQLRAAKLAEDQKALREFGTAVGRGVSSFLDELISGFSPLVTAFSDKMQTHIKAFEFAEEQIKELDEAILKKNGTHVVHSLKPELKVPTKTFNSGPPPKRFDRNKK